MEEQEYLHLAELENSYWWHIGRRAIISSLLQKHCPSNPEILNIGCGTGGTVKLLEKHGNLHNVDTSSCALNYAQKSGVDQMIQIGTTGLPFQDNSFGLIVALDVLEHIEDDEAALKDWLRVVKPCSQSLPINGSGASMMRLFTIFEDITQPASITS